LERVYAETTRNAEKEEGTLLYCLARDPEDRSVFHFCERYASGEALLEHQKQPVILKMLSDNLIKDIKAKICKPIFPAARVEAS
jgi:quinol monooxygenase YgiN